MKPCAAEGQLSVIAGAPLPAEVPSRTSVRVAVGFVIWLAVVGGATFLLARYSNTAGSGGAAPVAWPSDSRIPFDAKRPALVMFAHPRCPCTRATLGELELLLAQVPGRLNVHVLFLKPAGTEADWEKTDLWRKAASIPGVTVYTDEAGLEARRFHSETSGQTLLFDPAGRLQFQGGITAARGHSGDNAGRSALQELVRKGGSTQVKTPVFGCPLFEAHCQEGDTTCKP